MSNKAIEAAARAMCPEGTDNEWVEWCDGKGTKRRWEMYVPQATKIIAAYEKAKWGSAFKDLAPRPEAKP